MMTGFAAFHLKDLGHYSINTKASCKFAVAVIDKRLVCKGFTDSDKCENGEGDIVGKKIMKMILNSELLLMIVHHSLKRGFYKNE